MHDSSRHASPQKNTSELYFLHSAHPPVNSRSINLSSPRLHKDTHRGMPEQEEKGLNSPENWFQRDGKEEQYRASF